MPSLNSLVRKSKVTTNSSMNSRNMADFDAIEYVIAEDPDSYPDSAVLSHVPDPVLVRGSGHVTM